MNWSTLKKRLPLGGQRHAGHFVTPTFALELEPSFVAAARLNPSKRQLQSVGLQSLPAGVLAPSPNKANVADSAVLKRVISEVTAAVGSAGGKVGLLIPDVAVRVALLQFEALPDNQQEADALVLWRMREYLPYVPEEARLSYQVLLKQQDSLEVMAIAVRGSVLAEYESAMAGINGGPALVLPTSVALLPLLPEDGGGQLLLHLFPGALTAAVVVANRVRYWRTRPLEGGAVNHLDEVAREAARVLATCQDNLGVRVDNLWFCSRPPAEPEVVEALATAFGRELSPLSADFVLGGAFPSGQREVFDSFGTPFAGLLANQSQRR
jgi:hypothetical protein